MQIRFLCTKPSLSLDAYSVDSSRSCWVSLIFSPLYFFSIASFVYKCTSLYQTVLLQFLIFSSFVLPLPFQRTIMIHTLRNYSSYRIFLNLKNPFLVSSPPFQIASFSSLINEKITNLHLFNHTHYKKCTPFSPFRTHTTLGNNRHYQRRKKRSKPLTINDFPHKVSELQREIAQLPPRFTAEDLFKALNFQTDPCICLELFNYASQQPRFRHGVSTYHLMIKKLGTANLYDEMEVVVNQVLAVSTIGSEALFNTIIYFYTESRQLAKAINVFKHMQKSMDLACRPTVRTYNLLFTSLLSKRGNTLINHMYMETIRCLFKQMVNDWVEPDIISLNSMIKGYILSLHVNDALRIFHQMGVVYGCLPDSYSYSYLIHGLCCQGRTNNAKEMYSEMKTKGFVPSGNAYNSLATSLAMSGELEEAVRILWEMNDTRRSVDFITYRTILDEICRQGRAAQAIRLLNDLRDKGHVNERTYRKLLNVIDEDIEGSDVN